MFAVAKTYALGTLFVLLTAFGAIPNAAGADVSLKFGGTGGSLGPMRQLAEAFMKTNSGVEIEVLPSLGSGGGIKAVLAGAIDLSFSGRQLKEKERAAGAKSNPYGRTAVVLAGSLGDHGLEMNDRTLNEIFSGEIRNWPENGLIRLVMREEQESDIQVLMDQVPGFRAAFAMALGRPSLPFAYSDQENLDLLEKSPASLGVTTLGQILGENRNLKSFSFNGVTANSASITDKSYPLTKDFLFVTGPAPHPVVQKFMEFARRGAGRDLLEQLGYQVL